MGFYENVSMFFETVLIEHILKIVGILSELFMLTT
jgi:hypothetical protein